MMGRHERGAAAARERAQLPPSRARARVRRGPQAYVPPEIPTKVVGVDVSPTTLAMMVLTAYARERSQIAQDLVNLVANVDECAQAVHLAILGATQKYMRAADAGDAKVALESVAELLNAACALQICAELWEDLDARAVAPKNNS